MITHPWLVALATVVTVLLSIIVRRKLVSERYSLPPGPPVRRLWDNAVPTRASISATFNELANTYGPLITVHQGNVVRIVVARVNAATDIMEKGGSALGDRMPMIAADQLFSGGMRLTLTRMGERFRRLRKAVHTHLSPKAVSTYKNVQMDQARTLVLDILEDPKNHQKLVHRFSMSVILRVLYGKSKTISTDDPEFRGAKEAVAHFVEVMNPGNRYLIDRFPLLKYVPWYGRRLRNYHEIDLKFFKSLLDRVKQDMELDSAGPSFAKTLLENVDDHRLSINEMSFLSGTLFEGGADTSAVGLIAMIMAAACFPESQRLAQEELDSVVGTDRLPNFGDWDTLPRLRAFVSEALRWRPVTPYGSEHRSIKDIVWNGYRIPAGTCFVGNMWSITRDPIVFPDPERFDLHRWLDEQGRLRDDLECYSFGFGRRVCPGKRLAHRSLFIALSFMLWSFSIVQRPDAPVDTTPDRDNIVARPRAFQVDFVPRIEVDRLKEMLTALQL